LRTVSNRRRRCHRDGAVRGRHVQRHLFQAPKSLVEELVVASKSYAQAQFTFPGLRPVKLLTWQQINTRAMQS
jgi:hypothetical protein